MLDLVFNIDLHGFLNVWELEIIEVTTSAVVNADERACHKESKGNLQALGLGKENPDLDLQSLEPCTNHRRRSFLR